MFVSDNLFDVIQLTSKLASSVCRGRVHPWRDRKQPEEKKVSIEERKGLANQKYGIPCSNPKVYDHVERWIQSYYMTIFGIGQGSSLLYKPVLVLNGPTGCGKSRMMEWLSMVYEYDIVESSPSEDEKYPLEEVKGFMTIHDRNKRKIIWIQDMEDFYRKHVYKPKERLYVNGFLDDIVKLIRKKTMNHQYALVIELRPDESYGRTKARSGLLQGLKKLPFCEVVTMYPPTIPSMWRFFGDWSRRNKHQSVNIQYASHYIMECAGDLRKLASLLEFHIRPVLGDSITFATSLDAYKAVLSQDPLSFLKIEAVAKAVSNPIQAFKVMEHVAGRLPYSSCTNSTTQLLELPKASNGTRYTPKELDIAGWDMTEKPQHQIIKPAACMRRMATMGPDGSLTYTEVVEEPVLSEKKEEIDNRGVKKNSASQAWTDYIDAMAEVASTSDVLGHGYDELHTELSRDYLLGSGHFMSRTGFRSNELFQSETMPRIHFASDKLRVVGSDDKKKKLFLPYY